METLARNGLKYVAVKSFCLTGVKVSLGLRFNIKSSI